MRKEYKILAGKLIRHQRKAKGWSQETLAFKLGLTQKTITRYETGETPIQIYRFLQIADVMNVHPSRFFDEVKTEEYIDELNKKIDKYGAVLNALENYPELKEAIIFYIKHSDDIRGLNLPAFLKKYLQIPELERDTVTSYVNKLSRRRKLLRKEKKGTTDK